MEFTIKTVHLPGMLVGMKYSHVRYRMKVGDVVSVVPEPSNVKDKDALRVVWNQDATGTTDQNIFLQMFNHNHFRQLLFVKLARNHST